MNILAIDPGNEESALVGWDGERIDFKEIMPNREVLRFLDYHRHYEYLVVEMIASYGMPVGAEVFDTCLWIGRFIEHWTINTNGLPHDLVFRQRVKLHLCHSSRARDSNISQALKDRFGNPGTKKNPNPVTYGLKNDLWQAFALAVCWHDEYQAKLSVKEQLEKISA